MGSCLDTDIDPNIALVEECFPFLFAQDALTRHAT